MGLNRARVLYSWGLARGERGRERGGDGQYIVFELGDYMTWKRGGEARSGREGRQTGGEGGNEEKKTRKMCGDL